MKSFFRKFWTFFPLNVLLLLMAVLLIGYLYVVYDASKPRNFWPEVSEETLSESIEKLNTDLPNTTFEHLYKQGFNKALLVISVGDRKDGETYFSTLSDFSATWFKQYFTDNTASPIAEIAVETGCYQSISNDWNGISLNRTYKDIYGEEAAKGKPNYRYHTTFYIDKNDKRFFIDMFCNDDDFFDDVLAESVTLINNQQVKN